MRDGVHFQGYVVDVRKKIIVHFDSLRNKSSRNATSKAISRTLFDNENINFESFFKERVQFDSNSCGVWLVAGITSYIHALPFPSDRDDAFEIAYSALEFKTNNIVTNSSVPAPPNWKSEDHTELFSSAYFVINALTQDPLHSEFYTEDPPKEFDLIFFISLM